MELKTQVISAMGWAGITKLLGQIVTWGLTIYVMRLLSPGDYGLMAIATMFIAFLSVFSDLGMGAVIMHTENLNENIIRRIFGVVIVVNLVILTVLLFMAPLIAEYFGEADLSQIIRLLSIEFVFIVFEVLPRALLAREMKFKIISIIDLTASIVGGVTTLMFVLYGYAIFALVYGFLTMAFLKLLGYIIFNPVWYWPSFKWGKGIAEIKYGGLVSLERLLSVCQSQADVFIIGKYLGKELLGFYSVAMHLASLPMQRVMGTINPIVVSAFSKVQSNQGEISHYFKKAIRVSSFFTFPIFFGISSVSNHLIDTILGGTWVFAALPLQILCLVMPIRVIAALLATVLKGIGFPGVSVINLLLSSSILLFAFVFASRWGLIGICLVWVFVYPLVFALMVVRARNLTGVSMFDIFNAISRSALCATFMYVVVYCAGIYISGELNSLAALFILIFLGGVTYIIACILINRSGINEALSLIKNK